MREAKAAGAITCFPNGRRARGLPPLSRNPTIRRAQRLLQARVKVRRVVVAAGSDAMKAEKLGTATGMSLGRSLAFLAHEIDPRVDAKLFALQINTALSTIGNQIRLEAAALQAQAGVAGVDDHELV